MSIASEITRINNNIADAYTQCSNKGATMPATQNSANLANTISTISGGGGADLNDYFNTTVDATQTSSSLFTQKLIKKIPEITLESGVQTAYLFYNSFIENMTFDRIDLSNITDAGSMFAASSTGNSRIKTLDLTNIINTSNLTKLSSFLGYQSRLETIIGEKAFFTNTNKVNMANAFRECSKIKHLDLSGFNPASGSTGTAMFYNTALLATLDISNLDLSNISTGNFFQYCGQNCLQSDGAYADGIPYVYVKDATQQANVLALATPGSRPASWTTNNVVIKS